MPADADSVFRRLIFVGPAAPRTYPSSRKSVQARQTDLTYRIAYRHAELARRGWSDGDLAKIAGGNILRVLAQAEVVSAGVRVMRPPSAATLAKLDGLAAPAGPGTR